MSSAADNQRLIVLCERLCEATLAGVAAWRVEGEDAFVWEREQGSVSITHRDLEGRLRHEVAIFNPAGEQVDELSSELRDEEPAGWNETLAELHRLARRSALHADEIVDALIEAIPPAPREATPW